ncbi:Hypothetical Protein FCC1311_037122 [Hondaea fermentalgiana]|uniref:Sodium/glutamate symporter n=1 Tax=Hondaea fermentalgiana TaxID=2315210 RepID=A0A2R5G910_9STRA|nr:Hypothetical Protein FCC1311_037122 [Hondaea fermentalgiana]|eukprot:GBG27490.1 Hypothetical Protein FCC1311_037122 [Hondaea fermentalgiana]
MSEELPPFALGGSMALVSSFSTLFVFMYIGHIIREYVACTRKFMLPASLIGGLLALLFVQLCTLNDTVYAVVESDFIDGWSSMPGFLINIIFATLFMGKTVPSAREIWETAAPQIAYGWVIAWGNWFVACLLTPILFMPVWDTNPLFGSLGPVGTQGGHGTAAGVTASYTSLGFPEGGDLGITAATIGILFGVIVGTILCNIANYFGWSRMSYLARRKEDKDTEAYAGIGSNNSGNAEVTKADPSHVNPEAIEDKRHGEGAHVGVASSSDNGSSDTRNETPIEHGEELRSWRDRALIPTEKRIPGAYLTVSGDAIETLALHVSYLGVVLMLAYWTKRMLIAFETLNDWLTEYSFFSGFPLFPMCLLWGLVLQVIFDKYLEDSPLDRGMMERISGFALDVLVLTAVATTNLQVVADNIGPLMIVLFVILAFQLVCFFFLAPLMLPDFWVERALPEFGTSTATTSIGLMLLRIVDPQYETPAAKAFAAKQLITEPFLGGGVWTSLALPLIASVGNWVVFGISGGVMVFFMCLWFFVLRFRKEGPMFRRAFDPTLDVIH